MNFICFSTKSCNFTQLYSSSRPWRETLHITKKYPHSLLFIIERYKLKDCIEREKVCHKHTTNWWWNICISWHKKDKIFFSLIFCYFSIFLFGFKITICLFSLMCFGIKKQKKERHQHNAWFHLAKKAIYQVVTNSLNAVTFVVH